jgi:hypothetical protein
MMGVGATISVASGGAAIDRVEDEDRSFFLFTTRQPGLASTGWLGSGGGVSGTGGGVSVGYVCTSYSIRL